MLFRSRNGKPAPDVMVQWETKTTRQTVSAKTKADGGFLLSPLPCGDNRLLVISKKNKLIGWADVSIAKENPSPRVTIELPELARINGIAHDADGKPLDNGYLSLIPKEDIGGRNRYGKKINQAGGFDLDELLPGSYKCQLRWGKKETFESTLELKPGENKELRLSPPPTG